MEPGTRPNNSTTERNSDLENGEDDKAKIRNDIGILKKNIASQSKIHQKEIKVLKKKNEKLIKREQSLQTTLQELKKYSKVKKKEFSRTKKELEETAADTKFNIRSKKGLITAYTHDVDHFTKAIEKYRPGCTDCVRVETKYARPTENFEQSGRSLFRRNRQFCIDIEYKKRELIENKNKILRLKSIRQRLDIEIDRAERLKLNMDDNGVDDEIFIANVAHEAGEEFDQTAIEVEASSDSDDGEYSSIMPRYVADFAEYETLDARDCNSEADCYTDDDGPL